MSQNHPDYGLLAARVVISALHKNTEEDYFKVCDKMRNWVDGQNRTCSLLSEEFWAVVSDPEKMERIQAALKYERDFGYDFFGFKTLEKSYLLQVKDKVVERPQHLLMR